MLNINNQVASRQGLRPSLLSANSLAFGCLFCCVLFCASELQAYPSLVKNGQYLIERVQSAVDLSFPASRLEKIDRSDTFELVQDGLLGAATSAPQGAIVPYSPLQDRCAQIMQQDPSVISCSANFVKYLWQDFSDPLFTRSWALANDAGLSLHAGQAWEIQRGSPDVVVAVLDTGVDYTHPDLQQNIWINTAEIPGNGFDDDHNGYVDDIHGISVDPQDPDPMDRLGHGTHVAGIVAAGANNGLGTAGVASGVKILPVRFIDENLGTIFDLVKGMNYILDLKARGVNIVAINASYGALDFAVAEYNSIKRARDMGVLMLAAAGNESVNNDNVPSYPANYKLDNIISVASVGHQGRLSQFSNYGVNTVHIAAPGEDILSTVPGDDYASFDGTSAATPFVSGAVALIKSAEPGLSYKAVRSRLLDYATRLSSLEGLIDDARFLNLYSILSLKLPDPVDLNSIFGTDNLSQFELFAGDVRTGRRRVPIGRAVLLVLERLSGVGDFSPATVEIVLSGHACPAPFRTSVGDDLALLTTVLPSAWNNLRVEFIARNASGAVTGSDHIKFIKDAERANVKLKKQRPKASRASRLKRVCREFVRNTKIA